MGTNMNGLKSLTIALIVGLICPNIGHSYWTKGEINKELLWQGLHLIDTIQTYNIASNSDEFYERNLILKEHPSKESVILYMGLGAIVHPILTHYLPREVYIGNYKINPKNWYLNISLGVTGVCVINNFIIGVEF